MRLNTTGTSKDFFLSIATEIEEAVKNFWGTMTEEERKVVKELPPIAQRITFFNSDLTGANYKYYREALREWFLFGKVCHESYLPDWNKKLNLIEEGAGERVEELLMSGDFGNWHWYSNLIKGINNAREKLLAENPVLTNDKINIYVRRQMMNLALKADKWYVTREKEFTRMINGVISSLITKYLYQ